MKAPKTNKRVEFLDTIMKAMTSERVLEINTSNEDQIKRAIYPELRDELGKYYKTKFSKLKSKTIRKWVKERLIWETKKNHTLPNMHFMGANHRPDMAINDDISVAIEIKRGNNGASIREGIGQSMVYSNQYDFVMYLFIDTNKDKCIKRSLGGPPEQQFIKMLWDRHNIKFVVI